MDDYVIKEGGVCLLKCKLDFWLIDLLIDFNNNNRVLYMLIVFKVIFVIFFWYLEFDDV